jgi:hypothetical protein
VPDFDVTPDIYRLPYIYVIATTRMTADLDAYFHTHGRKLEERNVPAQRLVGRGQPLQATRTVCLCDIDQKILGRAKTFRHLNSSVPGVGVSSKLRPTTATTDSNPIMSAPMRRVPETEVEIAQRRVIEAHERVVQTCEDVVQRAQDVLTITEQLSQDCPRQLPAVNDGDLDIAREMLDLARQENVHSMTARALREAELADAKVNAAAAAAARNDKFGTLRSLHRESRMCLF